MARYLGNSNSIFIFRLVLIITSLFGVLASNLTDFFPKFEHFCTKNGNSIVFLVVGDWGRGGYFNQSRVANQMGDVGKKLDIDFVISTGDNFYDEGLKSADDPAFRTSFTNVYTATSLQKPWYIVLGNHDYLGNTEVQTNQELKRIDDRWHCRRNFIVGAGFVDIFFIDTTPFVDVYFVNPKKQNFDWKEILPRKRYLSTVRKNLDLALSRSKAPWKIVVGHHTIRSIGHHGDTKEIIDQLLPILEAHKVDMYINGHDHCLEHLSNIKGSMQFLTSGGGSKAWKNDIHYGIHNETMHFYYDGQGFMSVTITRDKGKVVFYDASGKSLYDLKLKTLEHRYFRG